MALEEYRRKRDFTRTPEPQGKPGRRRAAGKAELSFVIQKHAARRLHYDFRLELDGVLKSWAVPRGPSLDPAEKRLAVHVEDHPLDYGGFEGIIPPRQYGGGTVMLWDRGTWQPQGKNAAADYAKGHLKFTLDGEKLHGGWALVRMGGRAAREGRENWLLIKERDEEARPGSGEAVVRDNPMSVETGRDMAEIAADSDRIWDSRSGEVATKRKKPATRREAAAASPVPRARKSAMPQRVALQLTTLADAAPDGSGWVHEIKFDGYRILARIDKGKVTLASRNEQDWTARFPEIAARLAKLPVSQALIDGEIVAMDSSGQVRFSELQQALSNGRTGDLVYYAFDLLYLDGHDLRPAALLARKQRLSELLGGATTGRIRYSDHQVGLGPEIYKQACARALEGIVAKRADAPYEGRRSGAWLKIKCHNEQELVVVGFSDPSGTRVGFGSLLLGYYDESGKLRYAGRVGTGFDDRQLASLRKRLDRLAVKERPVAPLPKGVSTRDAHWVRPELVAAVRFAEWTRDDLLRQAAFLGLREDKPAREVVIERPVAATPKTSATVQDAAGEIAGIRLSNAEKVLYPGDGITKRDLADYYVQVARWALPHLARRPLALLRCPDGSTGECFFQKHESEGLPAAIRQTTVAENDGTEKIGLFIEDAAGLVGLVQIGVLEIHVWGAQIGKIERPDRLVFDLDPDTGLAWERVVEAALILRTTLRELGLESFVKTTGGKGLHIVVPIAPRLGWDEVKAFTKAVADLLADTAPDRFTATLAKRARGGRIFVDYLRNGRGATAVGAFSTRARPGATVSAPLTWGEVEDGIRSDRFTVTNLPQRLAGLAGDPWAGFFDLKQSITAAARRKLRL